MGKLRLKDEDLTLLTERMYKVSDAELREIENKMTIINISSEAILTAIYNIRRTRQIKPKAL